MKRNILLICLIIVISNANAQQESNIRGGDGTLVILHGHIIFYPKTDMDEKIKRESDNCKNEQNLNYINGLKISSKLYYKLNLRKKQIDVKSAYYVIHLNDNGSCINLTEFYININVPVYLNGKIIKNSEIKNIDVNRIYEIRNRYNLLKGRKIEIYTKSKL